jgi:hypothetical protein
MADAVLQAVQEPQVDSNDTVALLDATTISARQCDAFVAVVLARPYPISTLCKACFLAGFPAHPRPLAAGMSPTPEQFGALPQATAASALGPSSLLAFKRVSGYAYPAQQCIEHQAVTFIREGGTPPVNVSAQQDGSMIQPSEIVNATNETQLTATKKSKRPH